MLTRTVFAMVMLCTLGLFAATATKVGAGAKVRKGGGSLKPLLVNMSVSDGDMVVTEGASVTLTFKDQSTIVIQPGSRFMVTAEASPKDPQASRSMLISGGASLDLSPAKKLLAGKESAFKLYTPTAICGVRGTKFTAFSDRNGRSSVGVSEGLVAVGTDTVNDTPFVEEGAKLGPGKVRRTTGSGKAEDAAKLPDAKILRGPDYAAGGTCDPAVQTDFVTQLNALADKVESLKAEYDALVTATVNLNVEGDQLIAAGKQAEGVAKKQQSQQRSVDKYLAYYNTIARINQFRGLSEIIADQAVIAAPTDRVQKVATALAGN